ncbi:hypothetical protein A0J61_01269 [Choanephora cucurbitarum]|uniref:Uncharacterized protein n=1 Tax=Choanephora cucurbitarum TaxID=101091 RepID=A0A1C7NNK0_9FUNG|nr:hypothetical protein A0J61_01269 [Choanephora cucurbitarum]
MAPELFRSAFRVIPPAYHLLRLVDRFLPLGMDDSWTLQWLLDLPLQALLQNPPASPSPPPKVFSHHLLKDLLCYDASGPALLDSRAYVRPSHPLLVRLFDGLFFLDQESASTWVLHPYILCFCPFVAPSPMVPAPSSYPLVSSYLPTLCD